MWTEGQCDRGMADRSKEERRGRCKREEGYLKKKRTQGADRKKTGGREVQEAQADTERRAEKEMGRHSWTDLQRGRNRQQTQKDRKEVDRERQVDPHGKAGRQSEAGGQRSTEKPGPQKASGHPEVEQKVVWTQDWGRLWPGVGSRLSIFPKAQLRSGAGNGAPLARVSPRHPLLCPPTRRAARRRRQIER